MQTKHSIVFDIGGTHLRSAVAEEGSRLRDVRKCRVSSFVDRVAPVRVWGELSEKIAGYVSDVSGGLPAGAPIVISFPGPVRFPSRIVGAPTLVGGDTTLPDLQKEISGRTGRDTHIINDLSAAAWHLSMTVDAERFIAVTVSSGIGSKIFDRRHPFGVLDNVPFAGEIGHIAADTSFGDARCDCGGAGHLGAVASGRGIERYARVHATADPEGFEASVCATRFGGSPDTLTNEEHIVPAARARDEWALGVIRRCTGPLAKTLLALTVACGLERVVVIGGFALALGPIYREVLQEAMAVGCDFDIVNEGVGSLVEMGSDSEEACLEGAAVYASHMSRRHRTG